MVLFKNFVHDARRLKKEKCRVMTDWTSLRNRKELIKMCEVSPIGEVNLRSGDHPYVDIMYDGSNLRSPRRRTKKRKGTKEEEEAKEEVIEEVRDGKSSETRVTPSSWFKVAVGNRPVVCDDKQWQRSDQTFLSAPTTVPWTRTSGPSCSRT